MKKVFFILAFSVCATLSAQTQSKAKSTKVPAAATKAFAAEFPNMTAEWSNENGNFEAEFKRNGTESSVVYDATGKRKSFETHIKQTDLPEAAAKYLANNFQNHKFVEFSKVKNDQNVVIFEVEVTGANGKQDVIFDQKGLFLQVVNSVN